MSKAKENQVGFYQNLYLKSIDLNKILNRKLTELKLEIGEKDLDKEIQIIEEKILNYFETNIHPEKIIKKLEKEVDQLKSEIYDADCLFKVKCCYHKFQIQILQEKIKQVDKDIEESNKIIKNLSFIKNNFSNLHNN